MSGVLWGLCGALLIGGSDCIARVTAQKVSASVLFTVIMGLSTMVLSCWLALHSDWPAWHAGAWTASAVSGILNLVALFCLYRALARGPVAVASPAASTFTVLLIALNMLNGEPWTPQQLLSMALVFVGVLFLARPTEVDQDSSHYDARWLQITAALGLATAIAVSVRMFLAQEAAEVLGALHALYLNRLFALLGACLLLIYGLRRGAKKLFWPTGKIRILVLLQAIFESAALGAFLIGSTQGGRVATTIGFAAFAAATALFARFFLGERIGWTRGIWILLISMGIVSAMQVSA